MSSENEMVNPFGENQPDEQSQMMESDFGETAVVVDESTEEESDWEAWLLANPEEEEVVPETEETAVETPAEMQEVTAVAETPSQPGEPIAEITDEAPVQVDEAAVQADETSAQVDEASVQVDEASIQVDEASVQMDETSVQADETSVQADETSVQMDEAPVQVDEAPEPPKAPRKRHPQGLKAKDVIRYFAPCGRCGYFLTGYRAAYGEANFETAVIEEREGWLTLSWGNNVRELILKSYGREMEANDLLFSNSCPECRRVLVYDNTTAEEHPRTFRIELKPRER
jgi:hypothetical protein